MEIQNFDEIESEFIERVHQIVWCSFATMDTQNRPRTRIMHPIWESNTGWVLTYRTSLKAKHLAGNPHVSLCYMQDPLKPIYVDCKAEWHDEPLTKQRIWDLFANAPEPLGYDPAPIFGNPEAPSCGLLKLIPWRIELYELGGSTRVWYSK